MLRKLIWEECYEEDEDAQLQPNVASAQTESVGDGANTASRNFALIPEDAEEAHKINEGGGGGRSDIRGGEMSEGRGEAQHQICSR